MRLRRLWCIVPSLGQVVRRRRVVVEKRAVETAPGYVCHYHPTNQPTDRPRITTGLRVGDKGELVHEVGIYMNIHISTGLSIRVSGSSPTAKIPSETRP